MIQTLQQAGVNNAGVFKNDIYNGQVSHDAERYHCFSLISGGDEEAEVRK